MKRTTIIAIAILVVLTGVWWLMKPDPVTRVEAPLTIAAIEDLRRIEIVPAEVQEGPELIVLETREGQWWLTRPVESPLAPNIPERITEAFAGDIRTDDLRIEPTQAEAYDLSDEAAVKITLFGAGEAPVAEILVGKEITVPQTGAQRTFIRELREDQIYRAHTAIGELFRIPVEQLRDRRILELNQGEMTRFEIAHGDGHRVTFEKNEAQWLLADTENVDDFDVDAAGVSRFVNVAARLNAMDFHDRASPQSLGLEPPQVSVTLTAAGQEYVLHVGRVGEEDDYKYYVKRDDLPYLYEVSRQHGEQLTRRADSFEKPPEQSDTPE